MADQGTEYPNMASRSRRYVERCDKSIPEKLETMMISPGFPAIMVVENLLATDNPREAKAAKIQSRGE